MQFFEDIHVGDYFRAVGVYHVGALHQKLPDTPTGSGYNTGIVNAIQVDNGLRSGFGRYVQVVAA
jgi:hypothetical protein